MQQPQIKNGGLVKMLGIVIKKKINEDAKHVSI
jgi:hypothetical protein